MSRQDLRIATGTIVKRKYLRTECKDVYWERGSDVSDLVGGMKLNSWNVSGLCSFWGGNLLDPHGVSLDLKDTNQLSSQPEARDIIQVLARIGRDHTLQEGLGLQVSSSVCLLCLVINQIMPG